MPFAQIVALEHAISGPSIVYASFVPTMVAAISAQTVVYNANVYHPIARMIDLTHASTRVRNLYRLSKKILGSGLASVDTFTRSILTLQGSAWLLKHFSIRSTTTQFCKDWASFQLSHTCRTGVP